MATAVDDIDKITPPVEDEVVKRVWEVVDQLPDGTEIRREYDQKPLSYLGKLEFVGLIAQGIDKAMSAGMTVDGMLDSAQQFQDTGSERRDIDSFIGGIARLAQYLPGLIEEAQCIWLNIPRPERPWVKDVWNRSEDEGGLTDEEGIMMLNTFIDDNYESLRRFFTVHLPKLGKKIQAKTGLKVDEASLPLPRSKRTRQATPKQ